MTIFKNSWPIISLYLVKIKWSRQEVCLLVEMDKLTSLNFLNFILKDQGDPCAQVKNEWFTILHYATFSQHKINNIVSIKILTKKNAMISIKNDLDWSSNLFSTAKVYLNIKNTHISFCKKLVYNKLETGAPKKLRNCQYILDFLGFKDLRNLYYFFDLLNCLFVIACFVSIFSI